jgi:preprotein translocase subunit SecB
MSNNENTPQNLRVIAQYLKDLSFENPGQGSLTRLNGVLPEISINIQVNTTKDAHDIHKNYVDIIFKAISKIKDTPLFILEVTYTGVFEVTGFDAALEEQIVNIQCPALLFPFMRRIIGEKTVDGGYPPLLLDPIDFHALYMQKRSQQSSHTDIHNDSDDSQDVKTVFN